MPLSPTPNYGLEKPTPGADDDVWGEALNRNADTLDAQVKATDDRAALAAAQAAAAQAAADGKVAKIGDVMSGFLTLNADPTAPLHAATRQYVLANSAGLTDAPNDGALYGRQSLAWAKGVKLGGDTMAGALQTIAGTAATPALRMGDINSGLVGGADTVAVSTGGTARLTVSNTAVTSTLPVTLPAANPTGAAEAAHKGYVDAQVATRLTPAAADTAYVNVGGDTMSGALTVDGEINAKGGITNIGNRSGFSLFSLGTTARVLGFEGNTFLMKDDTTADLIGQAGNGGSFWGKVGPSGHSWKLSPDGAFTLSGNGWKPGGGAWADTSDARTKDVRADYTTGLDAICQIRPKTYSFKPETQRDVSRTFVGPIAQDIAPVMPETVIIAPGTLGGIELPDMHSFDASAVMWAACNAIRELRDLNAALAARIEALEGGAP